MTTSKPLGQIIAEAIRGEHEGWPLDDSFDPERSHEEAFKAGDGQRVLWQIYDCIQDGKRIPEWAATAFCERLIAAVTCNTTWNDAFGEIPAKGSSKRRQLYRSTVRDLARNLIRAGEAVRDYPGPKDEGMWETLSKRKPPGIGISVRRLKRFWKYYSRAHGISFGAN
jgi:hypothetical protein